MSLQRSALVWTVLIATLAILGQWNDALARLWSLPAALLLLGLAYERAAVRRWRVHARLAGPQRWPLGRERVLAFVFTQDARTQIIAQAALSAPDAFAGEPCVASVHLPRGRECSLTLRTKPRRLGRHQWPAPQLRLSGPLRLAWWPLEPVVDYAATVIPDVLGHCERVPGNARGEGAATHRGGGVAEIMQLREYRHGDPLRAIDWKATARHGRLISRDLSEQQRVEILIAIDTGRTSGLAAGEIDRLGLYVNVAARLAQRATEFDDAVGVLAFAERPLTLLPPARGPAAVARVRGILAECTVRAAQSNPALAAARIHASSPRRLLVVMLTDLLDAAVDELGEAVRLLAPKHFAFVCGLHNPHIAAVPATPARDALDPFRALAATEYHHTLQSNVRALRALGAAALTARPERLDRAVLEAYQRFRRERRV